MQQQQQQQHQSPWPDLLLHKVAPLCPALALKLRLVCIHLAYHIGKPTIQYIKHRIYYESPAIEWPKIWRSYVFTMTEGESMQEYFGKQMIHNFVSTMMPHFHRPRQWTIIVNCDHIRLLGANLGNVYNLVGPIPLKEPPQRCCLNCDTVDSPICLPPLDWHWTIEHHPIIAEDYIIQKKCK